MIRNEQEIESIVMKCSGTWVKRRNLRKKLVCESNRLVYEQIDICKAKIRGLRAMGTKEQALRDLYTEITKLELKLL